MIGNIITLVILVIIICIAVYPEHTPLELPPWEEWEIFDE